jgi:hypothetical protein
VFAYRTNIDYCWFVSSVFLMAVHGVADGAASRPWKNGALQPEGTGNADECRLVLASRSERAWSEPKWWGEGDQGGTLRVLCWR